MNHFRVFYIVRFMLAITLTVHFQTYTFAQSSKMSKVSFDVPSLIGRDIYYINRTLGICSDEMTVTDGGMKSWERGNGDVLMVFHKDSGQVVSIWVMPPKPEKSTYAKMLRRGNLSQNDRRYKVSFTQVRGKPGTYNGVIVTPK